MGALGRWKRKRRSMQFSEPQSGTGEKLSGRLIEIARPYLDCGDDLDTYRKEITFASCAWNLSSLAPASREKALSKTLNDQGLDGVDREMLAQHILDLVARKEQLFPDDRRLVGSVDVIDEGAEFRVLAASLLTE